MKAKIKLGLALMTVAASTVAGCSFKKNKTAAGTVQFWSSFGGAYTTVLNGVVDGIQNETGITVEHTSQGSYDKINTDMINAIAVGDYPNIAMGYPDHFATYLSSGILKPLDSYLSEDDIKDYYPEYMSENYFYDDGRQNAQKKIYALPFNKSTELLGYNGVFVDYCTTINPALAQVPETWGEWETKGPEYNTIFRGLMGKKVYGVQSTEGTASEFVVLGENDPAPAGKKLLLDMSKVDTNTSVLMSWDATDNAFITLTRQWGAEYTDLPETESVKKAKDRIGKVLFNSSTNQPKVISMLKFFNKLNKAGIFGTPQSLGGSYSSDAFAKCNVMFMICSSGGLSYNTAVWEHRFRVSPIPYLEANRKQVISQGANICMTDKGEYENSVKVIKALTTGKFQTEWCLQTGYYPCSKSALESTEYQAFLDEDKTLSAADAYAQPTRVAYREGSKLNSKYYMNQPDENGNKVYASSDLEWKKFVDPAFKGSSDLRQVVKNVLSGVFAITDVDDDEQYKAKLTELENAPKLKGVSTIQFVH